MAHEEFYKMLSPEFKYTKAYCTEDDIAMAETIRKFVNKEIMPHRHDLEGGWHRDQRIFSSVHTINEFWSIQEKNQKSNGNMFL